MRNKEKNTNFLVCIILGIFLIATIAFSQFVNGLQQDVGLDQEALVQGYEFDCRYTVEHDNPYNITDLDITVQLESDNFYECVNDIVIYFEDIETIGEPQEDEEFQCVYEPISPERFNFGDFTFTHTFDSDEQFRCPTLILNFEHANRFRATSDPHLWAEVEGDEIKEYDVENTRIPVTGLTFDVRDVEEQFENVEIYIASLNLMPDAVTPVEQEKIVYDYLTINKENIDNRYIEKVEIEFYVENEWLNSNNIDKSDVVLLRYSDGIWLELETSLVDKGINQVFYTSTSQDFSYFAIAGMTDDEQDSTTQPPTGDGNGQGTDGATAPSPEDDYGQNNPVWIVVLIGLIIVLVILIIFLASTGGRKKRIRVK